MKKISVITLSIILLSFCCLGTVKVSYANQNNEVVLRVLEDNVYFYSSSELKDSDRYFKLTKTYFLIGIDNGDSYYVRYKSDTQMELLGYVKKAEVEVYEEQKPSLIYPEIFAVCQGILSFYTKAGDEKPMFSANATVNLSCYGKIMLNNTEYILVYYSDAFYNGLFYIKSNAVNYLEPATHPIPIKSVEIDDNDNDSDANTKNNDSNTNINEIIQIVIILAIVVFALLVVYLMFRPGNLKYQKPKE